MHHAGKKHSNTVVLRGFLASEATNGPEKPNFQYGAHPEQGLFFYALVKMN